jgi:hypothetical protein
MRRQGNLLASEIMGAATDLREALRPVVAFRGELEKSTTEEQLRLVLLEGNLPEHITRALDMHQNLMLALAIGARAESEKDGKITLKDKIDKVIVEDRAPPEVPQVVQAPRSSFLDD